MIAVVLFSMDILIARETTVSFIGDWRLAIGDYVRENRFRKLCNKWK
jgi:hypothetical protein